MTLRDIIKKTIYMDTEPVTNRPMRSAAKRARLAIQRVFKSFSFISMNCLVSSQFIYPSWLNFAEVRMLGLF